MRFWNNKSNNNNNNIYLNRQYLYLGRDTGDAIVIRKGKCWWIQIGSVLSSVHINTWKAWICFSLHSLYHRPNSLANCIALLTCNNCRWRRVWLGGHLKKPLSNRYRPCPGCSNKQKNLTPVLAFIFVDYSKNPCEGPVLGSCGKLWSPTFCIGKDRLKKLIWVTYV